MPKSKAYRGRCKCGKWLSNEPYALKYDTCLECVQKDLRAYREVHITWVSNKAAEYERSYNRRVRKAQHNATAS